MNRNFARAHRLTIIAIVFLFAGCNGLITCSYQERFVRAAGTASDNGTETASAVIVVSATKGSINSKSFAPTIAGASLLGHVSAITLRRSDDLGTSLLNIPVDPAGSQYIASGTISQDLAHPTPDLGGIYEILASNLAVVDLTTDIAGKSHVLIPLTVTDKRDWYRPGNCY